MPFLTAVVHAFTRAFEDVRTLLGTTLAAAVTVIALTLGCIVAFLWQIGHLSLLSSPATTLLSFAGAWFTFWAASIVLLVQPKNRVALVPAFFAGLWITWHTFAFHAPGTASGITTLIAYSDQKVHDKASSAVVEIATEVRCDRTTVEHQDFFGKDATTGKLVSLYQYTVGDDGRIHCFTKEGSYDPKSGTELKAVTKTIVDRIRTQEPPESSHPRTASLPAPQPTPDWQPEMPLS